MSGWGGGGGGSWGVGSGGGMGSICEAFSATDKFMNILASFVYIVVHMWSVLIVLLFQDNAELTKDPPPHTHTHTNRHTRASPNCYPYIS